MITIEKKHIEDILALTPMQGGMLFHYLRDPRGEHYFEQLSLDISGGIDVRIFIKAWHFVIAANEMLRAAFRWEKVDNPVQIILKEHKLQPVYYDLSGNDAGEREKRLEEIKTKDRNNRFDLRKGEVPFRVTLCKLQNNSYRMILSNHHILYDGWSNGIILKEFFMAYKGLAGGKELLKPVKTKFKEFVKWTRSREKKKQERFWKSYLKGFDTRTEIPLKRKNKESRIANAGSYAVGFSKVEAGQWEGFVKKRKLTMASVLYGVWGLLLQRYNDCGDVVFGTTVSGRSASIKGIEEMVGLFINTLPLRVQSPAGDSVPDVLYRVDRMLAARQQYEATSLADIDGYSEMDNNAGLFDSIVVLENYPLSERLAPKEQPDRLTLIPRCYSMFETTHYDLTLQITLFSGIEINFNYNKNVLAESTVVKLAHDFRRMMRDIADSPGKIAAEIDILTESEKKRILYEFNDTAAEYPGHKTIHELFAQEAEKRPDSIAVIGNHEGHEGVVSITYREFDRTSGGLAHLLEKKGVKPGTIAGIMVERSIEMVIGIYAILKAGGTYLPIDPNYPEERKQYILSDSRAGVLVTGETVREGDGQIKSGPDHLRPAYIIYTSGSTGKPKGVVVGHPPVVNVLVALHREYPFRETDVYLFKTSFVFDVSVTELFGWFLGGGRLEILEKGAEKNPGKILDTIERAGVTHINFVPSMFNTFVDVLNRQNIEKLSALRYIFLAGEALLPELVNKFRQLNTAVLLENIYGPTEAAVYSSRCSLAQWRESGYIPIGKPLQNMQLYILDRCDRLQPVGGIGELCIAGAGVATGYLNRVELTAERFIFPGPKGLTKSFWKSRNLFSKRFLAAGGILYKTGDLCRWLPDGNIEFLGRKDHQVKIRGFRIELGEIENRLLRYAAIKEAVVTIHETRKGEGDFYLCAYIVVQSAGIKENLREFLSQTLPGYMIPAHFVKLEAIPLTPSGKVDRKALPQPEIVSEAEYVAPRNGQEELLAEIWSAVLGIEKEKIGIDDNFFELGGHSLKATALLGRVHKAFDREIPLSLLFKTPTIRCLHDYIKEAERRVYHTIESIEEKEYYPLSPTQERFYVFQQMDTANTSYNMYETMLLAGGVEIEKFETSLRQLIVRHESLRTSFCRVEGEPVLRVHDKVGFDLDLHDWRDLHDLSDWLKRLIRPFDFSRAPLLYVGLIKVEEEKHFLIVDMHHIIGDGVSLGIFIKEFLAFYRGAEPAPLRVRYRDYVDWMIRGRESDLKKRKREKKNHGAVFNDEPLNLPLDYARPAVQGFEGLTLGVEAGKGEKEALIRLALQEDATLYVVLLSAFYVLLSKLSGQESIVVGSPIAGRLHQDLEGVIGLFINTLALRNFPAAGKPFSEFLAEVNAGTLEAFENQEYQYEELIETVDSTVDSSRNPLFDVMFVLQNMELPEIEIPGLKITRQVGEYFDSKFDMTLYCEERDRLVFKVEYNVRLFQKETIHRFMGYFKKVISGILENPAKKIADIDILPAEEKRQILYDFNDTAAPYAGEKTIYRVLEEQAAGVGDRVAVIGKARDAGRGAFTYNELNEKANRLARLLRARGAGPGSIIAVMMERSVEMIVGIQAILKAGGAYLPIDPEYPENRVNAMLKSSAASMVLNQREILEAAGELEKQPGENLRPLSGPGDLIYIIFTSGSTGTPKGAGVFHRGFMNLMHWFVTEFELDAPDSNLWLTSLSFDLTQKNLYAPFMKGGILCIPGPSYFEPRALLRDIHDNHVTWINCTPSMFYKLVEYEESNTVKRLTSLRYVFLGGEPISMTLLIDWLKSKDCHASIVNTYGPTECTDICASYRIEQPRRFLEEVIPAGRPVYNVQLYVLSKNFELLPLGVAGELSISGAGIGAGYLNTPELTAKKFCLRRPGGLILKKPPPWTPRKNFCLMGTNSYKPGTNATPHIGSPRRGTPGRRRHIFYKTGDLVKWLVGGAVEFLGRIDNQVKVRGFRIELGEIESRLMGHENVKEAVVIAGEGSGGDKYLCAYIVAECGTRGVGRLKEYLAETLPDYMVPAYIIALEKMPLNPNGKVDRKVLPEPDITGSADGNYLPPVSEREKVLVDIWSEVLGRDRRRIGVHDNFFQLGGHSLKAAALAGRIHKAFSVEVPIAQLFKTPTVKGICRCIANTVKSLYAAIQPGEEKEYYPLSSAQKRLYILHRLDENSTGYNIPHAVELEGEVDHGRLGKVFTQLIHRHESLRTSFHMIDDEPVQRVHVHGGGEEKRRRGEEKKGIHHFIRPFDLSRAPLLRVETVKIEEKKHMLMVDMHHIVSDGISMDVFIKEFMALYSGEDLLPLKIQYKDFSIWQNRRKDKGAIKRQETYWLEEFAGEPPVLNLPYDYNRPGEWSFAGSTLAFEIEAGETEALKNLALSQGVTPYMVLLALFNVFLAKVSGQQEIVVGSPAAGREHPDLEQVIGIFINTLALRNYPTAGKTIRKFLKEVRDKTLEARENQEYQFEDLVELVEKDAPRDAGRNPLFDVMLVLQNMDVRELQIPGLELKEHPLENNSSKFDMTLTAVEGDHKIHLTITYSTALFKEDTIQRFAGYLKRIVSAFPANPDQRIAEIDILPPEEKKRLLVDFNDTAVEYRKGKTIHRLFAEQAAKTLDNTAVVSGAFLTYTELNRRSAGLARLLKAKGVAPDTVVGIMTYPSLAMIIGIMAILKAGGGYLPIDPKHPDERVSYMMDDSKARFLLTQTSLIHGVSPGVESIDIESGNIYKGEGSSLECIGGPGNLVYTIYTSGSTGKPKGVLLEHGNLVNYVCWFAGKVDLKENHRTILTSSFGFDLGYTSLFPSILTGAQLHILREEIYLSPENLIGYIYRHEIGYLKLTPSLFSAVVASAEFTGENCRGLRLVVLGGEEIKLKDVQKAHAVGEHIRFMNHYGPTEATIGCVAQTIDFSAFDEYLERPVIGNPIANMKVFILDRGLELTAVGTAGELCLSGAGVARGYLNHPELTAEKFCLIKQKFCGGPGGGFSKEPPGRRRHYKTGDLARWLWDGSIEFLGRIDSQIKIRGFRIELGEIESRLLAHGAVKEAVVIERRHSSGDKYLCAYIAVGGAGSLRLKEYLAETLPDYMVPSYIVQLEKIPLTPNGKLDRKLLPEPGTGAEETGYAAPRDPVEETLARLWQGVLAVEKIGIDDNFFQRGGHSLKAIMLVSKMHKALNAGLALMDIFKTPTIRGLAARIKQANAAAEEKYTAITVVEKKEYYPLSSAQKRLFILHRLDESGTGYNMPRILALKGNVQRKHLEDTFQKLIRRHESFRTSFEVIEEEPVQRIHEEAKRVITHHSSFIIHHFVRPFDLSEAPLLRVGLVNLPGNEYILMIDMHHIISDAVSRDRLIRDFTALYGGTFLPPLKISYKDYCRWQAGEKERKKIERQEEFWLKELSGEIPVLSLPLDYVRPAVQTFAGSRIDFDLGVEATAALEKLALENNATLYMVLLVVFNIFLAKITGQEEIVMGSPAAGRRHAQLEPVIGMFVNTLALRNYPAGGKSISGFLKEVRERTLAALENQDYPFEDLVEKTAVNRDAGRNPIFDVMFVLQNVSFSRIQIPGLELTPYPYENPTAKFDLTFICEEDQRQSGKNLYFTIEYSTKLFKQETIEKFVHYFKKVASFTIDTPAGKIAGIDIAAEEDKKRILHEFNDTTREYPSDKTIPGLFERQVEKGPANTALAGPGAGSSKNLHLSYRELNNTSGRLARYLREQGIKEKDFVGLMTDWSLEMITGILGILKSGAAYVPLNPKAPPARTKYILDECDIKVLLIKRDLFAESGKVGTWGGRTIFLDDRAAALPGEEERAIHRSSLGRHHWESFAYTIFTSGSTGIPKGVPIAHSNLSPLLHWGYRALGIDSFDRTLQDLSYYFDWSVWEIFITLTTGASLHIVPDEILLNPAACISYMNKTGITVLHATPTQWQYLAASNQPVETLKYLFIGAEKLTFDLAKRSLALVKENCRLFNMYGPTEATIISAVLEIDPKTYRRFKGLSGIPIGKPVANGDMLILTGYLKLCPVNITGELYISGGGLAAGYLNDPEKSHRSFTANIFKAEGIRGERLYKTGDLVRWLSDGNIEFLGRIDFQVKIRGLRIELGEIENRILEHKDVKEAVVIDRGSEDGEPYLCSYIVSSGAFQEPDATAVELKNYLSGELPGYMIPSYFVLLKALPLTPNGKVDRKALPEPGKKAAKDYTAPGDQLEKILVEIWSEVLGFRAPIGIDDDFFQVGGHSLKAAILAAKIHKALDVNVPLVEIFQKSTIRELAAHIRGVVTDEYVPLRAVEQKEYYPLSAAQARLYVLQRMDETGTGYNIPSIMELSGPVDRERLEQTFFALIRRHESLRTSFTMVNEAPVQGIHDDVGFSIEYYEVVPHHSSFIIHHFLRPFDLSRAPLVRAGLIKKSERKHILIVDMHHIVSDGTSMDVFVKEFMALYEGKQLARPRIQYKDFAVWQNGEKERESLQRQGQYWLKQFAGEIPLLNLPTDYPRPAVQDFGGRVLHFEINEQDTRELKQLALEESATLYMVLLSIYTIFLSKAGGQEDIVVGTPAAGRGNADLEHMIGMFVNTLALRNFPVGEKTFKRFLGEVKDRALTAFANQDYPYEELVESVPVDRDAGRNPLFDTMFTLQNLDISQLHIPGLKLKPYDHERKTAKFDLTVQAVEAGDRLHFTLEYCIKLFKEETIRKFTGYFKKALSRVLENPGVNLAQIAIISDEEKRQVLIDFNYRASEYTEDKTLHGLFGEQAAKTPDHIAVVGRSALSYRELNERSDRLALYLRVQGREKQPVGLMTGWSIEMIIGILGILKAGCAYVPLNPNAPAARTKFIMEECAADLVLTGRDIKDSSVSPVSPAAKKTPAFSHLHPQLAYVIFTSGSTGKPKGVPITHANICPLLHWGYSALGLSSGDRTIQNLSFYFDWSVWEIFITLTGGAALHIVSDDVLRDPGACISYMNRAGVTVLHVTPTQWRYLADYEERVEPLNYLFIGAEKLTYDLVTRSFALVKENCRVFNMYGPTEATIISAVLEIHRKRYGRFKGLSSIPIGKPAANLDLFVLDKTMNLCPPNIPGELYISGSGLASGYLNNPEMTEEKFCLRRPGGLISRKPPPWTPRKSFFLGSPRRGAPGRRRHILYKTGDLVRWLLNGNIEYLGRMDFQVKIRGFRIELGEIENRLLEHEKVKEVVVEARELSAGEKYLCAYIVAGRIGEMDTELKEYLAQRLPDYMVPAYFVRMAELPLNPNGKVDRKALPEPGLTGAADYTAPAGEIEEKIAGIWAGVLGIEKDIIGMDSGFFDLGGHSLKATVMVSKLHKAFHVKIPLAEVFKIPSIRGLSRYIKKSVQERHISICKTEEKEYYNVSSAQKRLYILEGTGDLGTTYNLPEVWEIAGEIDTQRLEQAFRASIERHESLRTSFHMIDGEPVQRIHETVKFEIEEQESRGGPPCPPSLPEKIVEDFIHPFDLSRAPLLRVGLIKIAEEKYILMVDMHHIISDGVSMSILTRDFSLLYEGEKLPGLKIQYKDFARWQDRWFEGGRIKELEGYWLERFRDRGLIPVLDMPLDYPRPPVQSFAGDRMVFHLDKELSGKINEIVSTADTTLYTGLLAVFNILLFKYTEQEDIIVGVPVAGRSHADIEKLMGLFVNTLAIRNYPEGHKTFWEFLAEVKENTLGAYDNQDYPLEELVDRLSISRGFGRNPLFDVIFASENVDIPELEIEGLEFSPYEFENKTAHVDLVLLTTGTGETIEMVLEYAAALFKPAAVEKMTRRYIEILKQVTGNPDIKLGDIKISLEVEEVKSSKSYDEFVGFEF